MDGVIWNDSKKEKKEDCRWADIKNVSFFFLLLFLYSAGALVYSFFFFFSISFHGLDGKVERRAFGGFFFLFQS